MEQQPGWEQAHGRRRAPGLVIVLLLVAAGGLLFRAPQVEDRGLRIERRAEDAPQPDAAPAPGRSTEPERVADGRGPSDPLGDCPDGVAAVPPTATPPTASRPTATRVVAPRHLVVDPAPAAQATAPLPATAWEGWLSSETVLLLTDGLSVTRVDGPPAAVCAVLQALGASSAAVTVPLEDTTAVLTGEGALAWLVRPGMMLQVVGEPDTSLADLRLTAMSLDLDGPRTVGARLPEDIAAILRQDGRLHVLRRGGTTIYVDEEAYAAGDPPYALTLVGDRLISHGRGGPWVQRLGSADAAPLGSAQSFFPAADGRGVWLVSGGTTTESVVVRLVDPVGRIISGPHVLPARPLGPMGEGLLLDGSPHAYWTPEGSQPARRGAETILAAQGLRYATCTDTCNVVAVADVPNRPILSLGLRVAGPVAFSPDGRVLAVATLNRLDDGYDIAVIDLERADRRDLGLALGPVQALWITADERFVIVDPSRITVVDGQRSASVPLPATVTTVRDLVVVTGELAARLDPTSPPTDEVRRGGGGMRVMTIR